MLKNNKNLINYRTDLAVERRDIYRKANRIEDEISGVICNIEKNKNAEITRVEITSIEGSKALNKEIGNYITIDMKRINTLLETEKEEISDIVAKEIEKIVQKHTSKSEDILIVGLGNLYSTPDSLGSKVVKKIEITRHVKKYMPQYLEKDARAISAIAPGVLGTTGIETLEFVKGVVDNVNPKLIIVIDSLCSKSMSRISNSIQISDTGIIPGGGVGNARLELSKKTLGIPVIAIRNTNSC
jgi:spore protease